MLSFLAYLIHEKVEALLRLPASEGIPAGYRPVSDFYTQPLAEIGLARRIQELANAIKAKKYQPEYKRQFINPRALIPTQHNLEAGDVADIISKRGLPKPITVARHQGRFYVVDGHHRAAASIYLQQPVAANVFPLD